MKTIPITRQALAVAVLMLGCVAGSHGQGVDFGQQEIETVKIADGVFVLMAGPAQGNILVSAGNDGIFLVDTMYAPMHDKIMAALAKISDKPIRYVVNTHVHGDHTAGNEAMAKLGAVIISHDNYAKADARAASGGAARIDLFGQHDAALQRRRDLYLSPGAGAYGRRFNHLLSPRQRDASWRRSCIAAV